MRLRVWRKDMKTQNSDKQEDLNEDMNPQKEDEEMEDIKTREKELLKSMEAREKELLKSFEYMKAQNLAAKRQLSNEQTRKNLEEFARDEKREKTAKRRQQLKEEREKQKLNREKQQQQQEEENQQRLEQERRNKEKKEIFQKELEEKKTKYFKREGERKRQREVENGGHLLFQKVYSSFQQHCDFCSKVCDFICCCTDCAAVKLMHNIAFDVNGVTCSDCSDKFCKPRELQRKEQQRQRQKTTGGGFVGDDTLRSCFGDNTMRSFGDYKFKDEDLLGFEFTGKFGVY